MTLQLTYTKAEGDLDASQICVLSRRTTSCQTASRMSVRKYRQSWATLNHATWYHHKCSRSLDVQGIYAAAPSPLEVSDANVLLSSGKPISISQVQGENVIDVFVPSSSSPSTNEQMLVWVTDCPGGTSNHQGTCS